MTNEELKVLSQLATELVECRNDLHETKVNFDSERHDHQCDIKQWQDRSDECERLRKLIEDNNAELADALNAKGEAIQERDDARHRLWECVSFMEDVWRDYSQINWKTKESRKRAKAMADKLKAWAEEKNYHAEIRDGRWVAK